MTGITVKYRATFRTARRGDRKAPPPEPIPIGPCRAARVLALGYHLEQLIQSGRLKSHADAARRLGVTEGRITQIMNLLLLAPTIQERLLSGALHCGERRLRRAASVPVWEEQTQLTSMDYLIPIKRTSLVQGEES